MEPVVIPPGDDALRREAGVVPREAGVVPREAAAVRREAGVVPREAGVVPREAGAAPREAGVVPREAAAVPREAGAVAQEHAAAPWGGVAVLRGRAAVLRRSGAGRSLPSVRRPDPGSALGTPGLASATASPPNILITSADFVPDAIAGAAGGRRDPVGAGGWRDPGAAGGQRDAGTAGGQRDAGTAGGQRDAAGADLQAACERAASALAGYGFLAVIAPGFDENICHNMIKAGLLPLCLPIGKVTELQNMVDADPVTLLTVHIGNRELTAGDNFSAIFEIAGSVDGQLPGGWDGGRPAGHHDGNIAESARAGPAAFPAIASAQLADRIRAARRHISSVNMPSDVRIHLYRRLLALCDAMKAAAADPARCEQRLTALTAELDRLAATPGAGNSPAGNS